MSQRELEVHNPPNLLLSGRKLLSAVPAQCMALLPFALQTVISPTDSYTLSVQMRFNFVPGLLLSALKTHMIKSLDVMLCCIMSH